MELTELKKALAAEAKTAGICTEWYNKILTATTKERLIAMYFGGFDFVESNNFPSEPLRREFDDIRKHFNIYEGETFSSKNPRRLVAYKGASGKADLTNFATANIYAFPGSEIEITASGYAFVFVKAQEDTKLRITAKEHARVIVFSHGGAITREACDKAEIKIL